MNSIECMSRCSGIGILRRIIYKSSAGYNPTRPSSEVFILNPCHAQRRYYKCKLSLSPNKQKNDMRDVFEGVVKNFKKKDQCKTLKDMLSDVQTNTKADAVPILKSLRGNNEKGHDNETKDVFENLIQNVKKKAEFKTLHDFMPSDTVQSNIKADKVPYLRYLPGDNKKVFLDIYGCQMNINDAEVITSILNKNGYQMTKSLKDADVMLILTCSIRESAENKIWLRLNYFRRLINQQKALGIDKQVKVGILGCMAERLKQKVIEKHSLVDVVAGPDSYKDLPRLLAITNDNETAINVMLSVDETYADIAPVRLNPDSVSAFVTIMRGCDNMCTYCIVPFTRGRERSRPINSIEDEIRRLSDQNVKEITLLGQNVNSYRDITECLDESDTELAKGFNTVYKNKKGGLRFCDLLDKVSLINPEIRIRFVSAHPKDFPDSVLQLISERPNICKSLHLPAQSGNSAVLERMRRGYTRESYLELVERIRNVIPNVYLSSDFIAGFCGETDSEFEDTISLLQIVKYNSAYLFAYSMREKTAAHRRYQDDIEKSIKMSRLTKMIDVYRKEVQKLNEAQIGQHQLVLIEGVSKKNPNHVLGRNDGNIRVILPNCSVDEDKKCMRSRKVLPGDYVVAQIAAANSQTLRGTPLYLSSIADFDSSTFRASSV